MAISFLQGTSSNDNATEYTFSGQNLGVADAARYIVVCVASRSGTGGGVTVSGVTVAGIAADNILQIANTASGNDVEAQAIVAVPAGTSGDVVVTFDAGMLRTRIRLYRLVGIDNSTPHDTATSTAADPTGSIDVPAGGVAIGSAHTQNTGAAATSWTGLAEDDDASVESQIIATSAHAEFEEEQNGLTITADFATSNNSAGVFQSWAPAAGSAELVAFPHPRGMNAGMAVMNGGMQ